MESIKTSDSSCSVTLVVQSRTDLGRVRTNNEDALGIVDFARSGTIDATARGAAIDLGPEGALLAVSDGMGGAAFGEVAAHLSIDALRNALADRLRTMSPDRAMRESVLAANTAVAEAATTTDRKGMGATLVAALVHGNHAYFTEVGDSRAYVARAGKLTQVTRDQSYAQALIDAGALKPQDVADFPMKNVILQAMGAKGGLDVPLHRLLLRRGDRLLLCTDGLTGRVTDEAIAAILGRDASPRDVVDDLVAAANEAGGDDNITVVLAEVHGGVPAPAPDQTVLATLETLHGFSVHDMP